MRENILMIVNQILSYLWLFIVIGLVHVIYIERQLIGNFFKEKHKTFKQLFPFVNRLSYILAGVIMVLLSFSIVNSILVMMVPDSIAGSVDFNSIQVTDFWSSLKSQSQFVGLVTVIGFTLSGLSLIMSGGGRWLVNLSKLLLTASFLYMISMVFIAYS